MAVAVLALTITYNIYTKKQFALCQSSSGTQKEQEPPKPDYGRVTGIIYSEDELTAVVDTNIVYEGDIIHNIKVNTINKHSVEFECNGEKWIQKVQQEPDLRWLANDPNKAESTPKK